MYMAIPRSLSSFLAAYLGRVPPGRPFTTDHEVKENPIQKSMSVYKLIPKGEPQSILHVSFIITWQVVIRGLVITGGFGEANINENDVCEDTTAGFVAHGDIGTHHVLPYSTQVVDDVTNVRKSHTSCSITIFVEENTKIKEF